MGRGMSGLPYFPLYPTDFEADTSHLTLEEDGAYNRLLRLMWMTPGCSLPDDDAWIMRRMRCDAETFARVVAPVLAEFFSRAKGRVFSPRLSREFDAASGTHAKRVESGKKGGRKPKPLKNNDTEASPALGGPKQPEPEPYRDTEAIASDAGASSEPNFSEEVWTRGVRFLQARGVSERNARTVIGKWLRDHEAASVFSAFDAAIRERPVEPVAWITARLGSPPKPAVDMDAIWKSLETGTNQ